MDIYIPHYERLGTFWDARSRERWTKHYRDAIAIVNRKTEALRTRSVFPLRAGSALYAQDAEYRTLYANGRWVRKVA